MNEKQYNYLSFFLTRVLFLGGGFSLLFNKSSNNALLCSFMGMLLGYFLLYIFYKKGINKYNKYLIAVIILFINLIGCGVLTSSYLLPNTPILLIILLFIGICIYGSKDITIIARVSFILFFISIGIILLACLGLLSELDFNFSISNNNIISGILLFATLSLLPNLLIIDYSNNYKFYKISKGYIIGCISNINVVMFINFIFGYKLASIVRFPEYFILKQVNLFSFISNIENILVMEWIVTIILSGMVCINTIRNNNIFKYLIVILITIVLCILTSNYNVLFYIKNYICYVYMFLIICCLVIKK